MVMVTVVTVLVERRCVVPGSGSKAVRRLWLRNLDRGCNIDATGSPGRVTKISSRHAVANLAIQSKIDPSTDSKFPR